MASPLDDFEEQAAMFAKEQEADSVPVYPENLIPEVSGETIPDADLSPFEQHLEDEVKRAEISAEEIAEIQREADKERESAWIYANRKPILFRSSQDGRYGEAETVEQGVGIHVKYEFEFSSTLAGKNLDAYTPHIEVDLTLPGQQVRVTNKVADGVVQVLCLSEVELEAVEDELKRRLNSAANVANSVALAGLASLISADKVRSARS